MSFDFLSGLLLATVVVFALVYVAKEWFGLVVGTSVTERRAAPPRGVNAHLIGATGRIVDTREETGEMRVRIGIERWSARLPLPAGAILPIGTEVEVKAVDGFVLEVAEKSATAPVAPEKSENSGDDSC